MKKERSVIRATEALGLSSNQAIELLTHRAIGVAQSDSGVVDGMSDASDRPEGSNVIVWWNDLETDSRYDAFYSLKQGLKLINIVYLATQNGPLPLTL